MNYLVGGKWWHGDCYHEEIKPADSPLRGVPIDRLSALWPKDAARILCPACASRANSLPDVPPEFTASAEQAFGGKE